MRKVDMDTVMKSSKLPSSSSYPRHTDSYRSSKDHRPHSSRRITSALMEKQRRQSSSFIGEASVVDQDLIPSTSQHSANVSSRRKSNKEPYHEQEVRRSRRASHRSSGKDRRNSAYEREKVDKSFLAAGKTLFSGIKNALAKS